MVIAEQMPGSQQHRSTRRRRSDSSSDLLRSGGPNSFQLLVNGIRHASRGAMFVAGVSVVIAMVSILARV